MSKKLLHFAVWKKKKRNEGALRHKREAHRVGPTIGQNVTASPKFQYSRWCSVLHTPAWGGHRSPPHKRFSIKSYRAPCFDVSASLVAHFILHERSGVEPTMLTQTFALASKRLGLQRLAEGRTPTWLRAPIGCVLPPNCRQCGSRNLTRVLGLNSEIP